MPGLVVTHATGALVGRGAGALIVAVAGEAAGLVLRLGGLSVVAALPGGAGHVLGCGRQRSRHLGRVVGRAGAERRACLFVVAAAGTALGQRPSRRARLGARLESVRGRFRRFALSARRPRPLGRARRQVPQEIERRAVGQRSVAEATQRLVERCRQGREPRVAEPSRLGGRRARHRALGVERPGGERRVPLRARRPRQDARGARSARDKRRPGERQRRDAERR